MKTVPLTRGMVALVDDEDYDWAMQFNWYAQKCGKYFYAARSVHTPKRSILMLHRVLMGSPRGKRVDHINHATLDCQKSNLRPASGSQNVANSRKTTNTTSRFKGVSWDPQRQKWKAQICLDGRRKSLGRFTSEKVAAHAYDTAARESFGEFALVNKI